MVQKWVNFYKRHRQILISDIIHVRRADMQSVDAFMHVNPALKEEKGLLMVFNPTGEEIRTKLEVDLYYTGITRIAGVKRENGTEMRYSLSRSYKIWIDLSKTCKNCASSILFNNL